MCFRALVGETLCDIIVKRVFSVRLFMLITLSLYLKLTFA